MRLHKLALLALFATSIVQADNASISVTCKDGKCTTMKMTAPPAIILKNGDAIWLISSSDGIPCYITIARGGFPTELGCQHPH